MHGSGVVSGRLEKVRAKGRVEPKGGSADRPRPAGGGCAGVAGAGGGRWQRACTEERLTVTVDATDGVESSIPDRVTGLEVSHGRVDHQPTFLAAVARAAALAAALSRRIRSARERTTLTMMV